MLKLLSNFRFMRINSRQALTRGRAADVRQRGTPASPLVSTRRLDRQQEGAATRRRRGGGDGGARGLDPGAEELAGDGGTCGRGGGGGRDGGGRRGMPPHGRHPKGHHEGDEAGACEARKTPQHKARRAAVLDYGRRRYRRRLA